MFIFHWLQSSLLLYLTLFDFNAVGQDTPLFTEGCLGVGFFFFLFQIFDDFPAFVGGGLECE